MAKAEGKKAGVLGWPITHSLSPRLHGYWLGQYNIPGSYEAIAVEPKDLEHVLRALPEKGFAGVNLTVPHKEQALEFMDEIDSQARRIGAINTVVIKNGKLMGSNTDGYGFIRNLKSHHLPLAGHHALVVGAGGAARAVCAALLSEGVTITLTNRTREKSEALAAALGGKIEAVDWAAHPRAMEHISLLVNTTPLGMKGEMPLRLSLDALPHGAVVTDIVYNPLVTPLLVAAKARGNAVIDGLGMLLYQAQPGFEAWFGVRPEVTPALREHVMRGYL